MDDWGDDDEDEIMAEMREHEQQQEKLWQSQHEDELEILAMDKETAPSKRLSFTAGSNSEFEVAVPVTTSSTSLTSVVPGDKRSKKQGVPSTNPFADSDSSDDDGSESFSESAKRARTDSRKENPQTVAVGSGTAASMLHQGTVYSKPPFGRETVQLRSANGKQFFLGKLDEVNVSTLMPSGKLGLLTLPFEKLKTRVSALRLEQALRQSKESAAKLKALQSLVSGSGSKLDNDIIKDDDYLPDVPATEPETKLWVDSHAPRRYTELVSDEDINKKVLRWLKTWDKVVFGRDPPVKQGPPPSAVAGVGFGGGQNSWEKRAEEELTNAKVVLLSGPPGAGKTTLAHIVANQAGYNAMEINASDDRSPDIFKLRIQNATQMSSVMAMDKRPNCIVLDEIDGATKAAINVLIAIASNTAKGSGDAGPADEGGIGSSGKKKKRKEVLRRPIICICNDLNAPSLRALRKIALEVKMPAIPTSKLVGRLETICRYHSVRTDARSLSALCDNSGGDIRSCISTLQFAAAKTKRITMDDLSNVNGSKDREVNVFTVYDRIFHRPKPSTIARASKKKVSRGAEEDDERRTSPQDALLELVQANGDYSKITEGCFENYLTLKGLQTFDPNLNKITTVNQWACFNDEMQHAVTSKQYFGLTRYLPYTAIAFHHEYNSTEKQFLKYPSESWNVLQRTNKTQEVIDAVLDDAAPRIRRMLNPKTIVLDLITPMLDLLSPAIRPVAPELLSLDERAVLNGIVSTMIDYNLTFKQERTLGGFVYKLEPALETILDFGSGIQEDAAKEQKPWMTKMVEQKIIKPTERAMARTRRLTYNTKQLIVQQIAQARVVKLHENDAAKAAAAAAAADVAAGLSSSQAEEMAEPAVGEKRKKTKKEIDEFLQARIGIDTGAVKAIGKQVEETVTYDFFGRKKVKTVKKIAPASHGFESNFTNSKTSAAPGRTVRFKFQEGFSDAVRKPLRLRDLI